MIIIYMQDEKIGIEVATKMVEKGYENTVLLSGGIEKFLEEATELVEGSDVPTPQKVLTEEKEKARMKKTGMSHKKHDDCKKI